MKTSEILRGAATLIETEGWYAGAMRLEEQPGRYCAATAIRKLDYENFGKNRDYFEDFVGIDHATIAWWNDVQPNGGVVIAALRQAADKAELEEGGQR